MSEDLTDRQRAILEFIVAEQSTRGYPPSVREIGEAVGLTSPSTVHSHLETLQRRGYLRKDPTKPRAIEVRWDPASGGTAERRPLEYIPVVGNVAAGTDVLAAENIEELMPIPVDLVSGGEGVFFALHVRGDSMIDKAILDGDLVVVRQQSEAKNNDIVVAGIPGDEATVKTFTKQGGRVVLVPANSRLAPMELDAADVTIYGKVVSVMRRL